jgi:superfamily II DNA or RNA helicase
MCSQCFRASLTPHSVAPSSVDPSDERQVAPVIVAKDSLPASPNGREDYESFLARKLVSQPPVGITKHVELGKHLYDFQDALCRWALRRGRAAIFADCGLGKTPISLEWAHAVAEHTGGQILILAPLAVAQQFVREGVKFGRPVKYARDASEVGGEITVTNYERLGKFDTSRFAGVVADESSVLKHHDARTRADVIAAFAHTRYKLSCTATPSPNDFRELGGQAHFLSIMTEQEMLARYFIHDNDKSSGQGWRIKGHAKHIFWRWVCTWAATIRRPSDLGFGDDGFILPAIHRHQHVIKSEIEDTLARGSLFVNEAGDLSERRSARRESIDARVEMTAQLVAASPRDEQWLLWCGLNAEGDGLEESIPGAVQVAGSDSVEDKEKRLTDFCEGRTRVLITKPSIAAWGLNIQNCRNTAFVGLSDSYEEIYQAEKRFHRHGQKREVHVHVVTSEREGTVVANIERKTKAAAEMGDAMVAEMRDTLRAEVLGAKREHDDYKPTVPMAEPTWLKENARLP